MLTVGRINYINNLPFYAPFLLKHIHFNGRMVLGTPAELNQKLAEGSIDISLISSFSYLQNQNTYCMFPEIGVASKEKVMSVTLYIKNDIASLNGICIGLTPESASSSQLLKILCAEYWNVRPTFKILTPEDQLTDFDAFLLIGDKALLNAQMENYQTLDLAESWNKATGYGFPFAVFAARREIAHKKPEAVIEYFEKLKKSLDWSEQNFDKILEMASINCDLPMDTLEKYFKTLKYRLAHPEMEGLRLFAKHAKIPYQPHFLFEEIAYV